jgi:glycine/D-amino acid oxidase-like deaminating enzyme
VSAGSEAVVVVGAGAVGVNIALFLSRLGFEVVLMDHAASILDGATRACFINHGDGFEYYKPHHHRTGEYCIDGALTKALIHPIGAFATGVCDAARPIRFLVSNASVESGELTLRRFFANAEWMRAHFARQFDAIRAARGWSDAETERRLLRNPQSFARPLVPAEYSDIRGVIGGWAGSSFGINMPQYYAFMTAALLESSVVQELGNEPLRIEKTGRHIRVQTAGGTISARAVLLVASHHIPLLASRIAGAGVRPPMPGTYYLNAMTFLRLPPTGDAALSERVSRINFTLQQEHGAMFACIVPPSSDAEGFAAIYQPSSHGSQLRQHVFDAAAPAPPPEEWNELIRDGLPNDGETVRSIFQRVCEIYPFLRDYAEISHTICRPVFNVATRDSAQGTDRRVREIAGGSTSLVDDGSITAWAAPKWTNAELVALMAADHVSRQITGRPLPAAGSSQFGPASLDVAEIARVLDFTHVRMRFEDAAWYARTSRIPERIIDRSLPQFEGAAPR